MSSTVPYIAPWQTGFEKYSTQVYPVPFVSRTTLLIQSPSKQWWRVIYMGCQLTTDATVGPRMVSFSIVRAAAAGTYIIPNAAGIVESMTGTVLVGPGLQSYTTALPASSTFGSVATITDALWEPNSFFQFNLFGPGNDTFINGSTDNVIAVEIYTESRPGVLTPAAPTQPNML